MKKFFVLCLAMVIAAGCFAQQTWTKGSGVVSLYGSSDKVGVGTTAPTGKLTVKSLAGETPLVLSSSGVMTNPYLSVTNQAGVGLFKLFAQSNWWGIGSSFDSTTMLLSAKPNKGWIRWNAVGSWTGLQTNYLTFVKGYSPPDGPNGVLYFNDDYRLHWYDDNEGDQTVATVEYMNSVMPAMAHDSAVAYKRPYKVYTAKLHQTGTNAPTATVFENSIGNISFNRPQLGQFSLACSGFDSTKTVVLLKENSLDPGGSYVLNWSFTSLSSFIINGYQIDIASPAYEAVDAAIRNAYIEIRVYD